MSFTLLNPKSVHPTVGYSHAARLGDLLFVSGQVSKNEHDETIGVGDAERQTEVVYENLKRVLEESGSGLDMIGKTTVFTTSLEHRPAINRVRERVFGPIGRYPASTFVVVSSLAVPEWLVEIEVIAVVRKSG
jgi:enamine deaminase RidA (YjgF/YER057c/UK114 family)